MGVSHSPRLFGADKGDHLGALCPLTHQTRKVIEEAITRVGGRPRGFVLRWAIEEEAASLSLQCTCLVEGHGQGLWRGAGHQFFFYGGS